jgi:hypothetical protein
MKQTTAKKLSRQRLKQLRLQAEGRCIICGKKRDGGSKYLCKHHTELKNERQRAKLGHNKWKKGGRGRPPLTKAKKSTK